MRTNSSVQNFGYLKFILRLEPKLARLEATVAAGTVSDLCNLFWDGGLPSNVADRCTGVLNKIGSSESCWCCGTEFSGGGVTHVSGIGCSKAPNGSFSVITVLGETLQRT